MAKSKEVSEKKVTFAKGGTTKMFGQQGAEPQKAGESGHDPKSQGAGAKFAKGGSGKMFGFRASEPAKAGQSSP